MALTLGPVAHAALSMQRRILSFMRHAGVGTDRARAGNEPGVRGYAVTHAPGLLAIPQSTEWDQLVHATRGVLVVRTPVGVWVVPPHRAIWIPAAITHHLELSGRTTLRTVYVARRRELGAALCRVVDVPPLARELILQIVREAPLWLTEPRHDRLVGLLLDEIDRLPEWSLRLPEPGDPRARRVADSVRADVAHPAGVEQLAAGVSMSRRTLERLFLSETGMGVAAWRRRSCMIQALRLLADGLPAGTVATRVGYATQSAFGAAFRLETGTSPARWARGG